MDNGLRVVVLPDSTPGLVAVQTWISVGSGAENVPGSTGYAHFLEHLMFHGTPTLSGPQREARLVAMGVEENAWTSQDETCYFLLGPAQHLEELLRIEADRFANLSLDEEGVRREAGAVYGEYRNSAADPDDALWLKLWGTAFDRHPYGHNTLGLLTDIEAMPDGLQRAMAFKEAHYRPDNALVVVVGDVDPSQAMAQVEKAYGAWSAEGTAPPAVAPQPPQTKSRRVHIDWKGPAVDPKMAVGWRVPAFKPGDANAAALDVVRELLMSRASGLVRALIDDQGLAYEVWSEAPDRADPGLLYMMMELKQGTDPDAVLAAVDAAILDLAQVSPGRVAMARGRVQRRLQIQLAGPEGRAHSLGRMALHGDGVSAHARHAAALAGVDVATVQATVKRILVNPRRTVVTLSGGGE